ncbi:pirin family protein [Sphingomonas nostoxanthinifaciens]|uniref:pirin family protein n=1 Tax=Sphingomonas nostoxanthinifaciens TaxID=2872652 RepID=UPI001CC1E503|nr:pirin family protein [Sphingomonas nostoxanthinifaciens]UAK24534.1 pirin family protein [Sphingomonas nostoxanthinifaciens]
MTIFSSDIDAVDTIILPPVRDLGDGFQVRRALPSAHRRMVGPFIFFDQMGPAAFHAGNGLDVRPHPHIGLATVTYLLDGEILHRDSVGSVQAIRPGEVNWMTAGAGIVHSERTGPETRATGGSLYGLQVWVALPTAHEETAPAFAHHRADAIPQTEADGVALTVIAGRHDGLVSPVATFSDMVYADVRMAARTRYQLRAEHVERAIYVVEGTVGVIGQTGAFTTGEFVIFKPGAEIVLESDSGARLMLVGGEPFPETRHIFWNFVSSRADRIEQAKEDWRARRFAAVPDERDFIPLPEAPPPVRYP